MHTHTRINLTNKYERHHTHLSFINTYTYIIHTYMHHTYIHTHSRIIHKHTHTNTYPIYIQLSLIPPSFILMGPHASAIYHRHTTFPHR